MSCDNRPWNVTYPNRCSEDYSRLPLWIILFGKSPVAADKPRLWKSPAHYTTVIFCLGTKPQLCTLFSCVGSGRPILHEQHLDRRQRLFLAALIRKEVQAEKEREKLDMSQLAFPLPRQGKVQLKRQQIGESHGLEPGLPHAPRPSAAQTRQSGLIWAQGPH